MSTLDPADLREAIRRGAEALCDAADELTGLDRAIGDGDHGINMQRGAEVVQANLDAIAAEPIGPALQSIGRHLVMSVGGASGPLFGTFFLAFGKALPETFDRSQLAGAFLAAVEAVKARGRSDEGQKTLIDVLSPVGRSVARGDACDAILRTAEHSAAATIAMRAIRGRAAYLGERSIGHMDPGARSVALLVDAVGGPLQRTGATRP